MQGTTLLRISRLVRADALVLMRERIWQGRGTKSTDPTRLWMPAGGIISEVVGETWLAAPACEPIPDCHGVAMFAGL